ncbi:MAG: hypothetical protein IJ746_03290 [Ruminococcus sp.]|nr:hypothetical protein [Ruminococcus sp.]
MTTGKILILAVCATMLAACAEAPEEVREEISIYDAAEAVEKADIRKASFEEVLEEARELSQTNGTNVKIESIILPESEAMPTYTLELDSAGQEELFAALTECDELSLQGGYKVELGGDIDSWRSSRERTFTYGPELPAKVLYKDKDSIKISDSGIYYNYELISVDGGITTLFSSFASPDTMPPQTYSAEGRYYTDLKATDDSYTLYDGSAMTVAEAAEMAEGFANSCFSKAELSQFTYQADYIDARRIEDDRFGMYIVLCRRDSRGSLFDSSYGYLFDLDRPEHPILNGIIYLWVTGSGRIEELEHHYPLKITEERENSEYVTLGSAVEILSYVLAQGTAYDIRRCTLKYVPVFTDSDYERDARAFRDSLPEEDRSLVQISPEAICRYGSYTLEARPCWVFETCSGSGTQTNCGTVYIIDALSGELRIERII